MTRIGRVTVKGDGGHSPCQFRTIIENGVAVLSVWSLSRFAGLVAEYVRVG